MRIPIGKNERGRCGKYIAQTLKKVCKDFFENSWPMKSINLIDYFTKSGGFAELR